MDDEKKNEQEGKKIHKLEKELSGNDGNVERFQYEGSAIQALGINEKRIPELKRLGMEVMLEMAGEKGRPEAILVKRIMDNIALHDYEKGWLIGDCIAFLLDQIGTKGNMKKI